MDDEHSNPRTGERDDDAIVSFTTDGFGRPPLAECSGYGKTERPGLNMIQHSNGNFDTSGRTLTRISDAHPLILSLGFANRSDRRIPHGQKIPSGGAARC